MNYEGSCHCGQIAFDVEGDFTSAIDCNWSLCRRRGGLLAFVPRDKFSLKTPREALSTYTFNTHVIQHHFCSNCGVGPFSEGKMPDGTEMACINLRCVPAVDLATIEIQPWDGKSH
jgi:hypothetical protein